jgi:hypothetical protein
MVEMGIVAVLQLWLPRWEEENVQLHEGHVHMQQRERWAMQPIRGAPGARSISRDGVQQTYAL